MERPFDPERWQQLLVQALDGELSSEEHEEFMTYVRDRPECREEWHRLQRVKEAITMCALYDPPEEFWDAYRRTLRYRLERRVAWVLISIGVMVIGTFGLYQLVLHVFTEPNLPEWVRWGILSLIGGLVILFVSVVREKWFLARTDRYRKEVIR